MRLIDADALMGTLNKYGFCHGNDRTMVYKAIQLQPTIDPDPDTVSRQAVLNALVTYREDMMHHFEVCYGAERNRIDDCISLIKNLPPSPIGN